MRMIRFTPRFYLAGGAFVLIVLFGIAGPWVLPTYGLTQIAGGSFSPPSGHNWLGTDNINHDVLTNLMYGIRSSLLIGLVAGAVATAIGCVLGLVAGFRGGLVEEIITGVTNVVIAIPSIVVLVLLSVSLGSRSNIALAVVIALTSWPWTARAVQAQTNSLKTREHIDVARLSGAGFGSVLLRDVLPYVLSYLCMAFVLQVSSAILNEAALSMLGLGPSDGVSLGTMLHWALANEAVRSGNWWVFVPPTIVLTLIAFTLMMLQSSLDEVFNPRLRRGGRRRRPSAGAAVAAVPAQAVAPTAPEEAGT